MLGRAIAIGMFLTSTSVYAAECNFDKPIGGCQGSIEVTSSGGSKPSYSAEIVVRSSVPSCSKVEFRHDATPQTTVLRGGNSDVESLFGTSPISKRNLKVLRCTAYEDRASRNSPERRELVRRFGGCADDKAATARIAKYNTDGSSLDELINFLPKGIAANRNVGDNARVEWLSDLLSLAKACKAKGG